MRSLLASALCLCCTFAIAQPTYKLDAKRGLKPKATITLADGKVSRSAVEDDSGYRLQFHFTKDGKTVATPEARSEPKAALPTKEPGTYTVTLELFHPAYKGGKDVKGKFEAISEPITYKIETKEPLKVTIVPAGKK